MAYEAEMAALEQGRVGAPVGWRNPGSGRYGNIVPGPVYVQRGSRCRSYTHTVYVRGRPEVVRGTACRNPDGTWTAAQLILNAILTSAPVMTAGGAFRAIAWILARYGATGTIAACQVATGRPVARLFAAACSRGPDAADARVRARAGARARTWRSRTSCSANCARSFGPSRQRAPARRGSVAAGVCLPRRRS